MYRPLSVGSIPARSTCVCVPGQIKTDRAGVHYSGATVHDVIWVVPHVLPPSSTRWLVAFADLRGVQQLADRPRGFTGAGQLHCRDADGR